MTQNAKLLTFLESNPNGIRTLDAMEKLRILRLSQRIIELERLGYLIEHSPEKTANGARVMRYRLIKPEPDRCYYSTVQDPSNWDATPMGAA